jgi:hypothetical protein
VHESGKYIKAPLCIFFDSNTYRRKTKAGVKPNAAISYWRNHFASLFSPLTLCNHRVAKRGLQFKPALLIKARIAIYGDLAATPPHSAPYPKHTSRPAPCVHTNKE